MCSDEVICNTMNINDTTATPNNKLLKNKSLNRHTNIVESITLLYSYL